MANLNGTNILGAVLPFTTDDVYSTHHAKYGKGGIRTVKDLTERNLIFSDRRENLMVVCVEDNSFISSTSGVAFYILDINNNASTSSSLMDNNNWVLLDFGYGADGWIFPPPPQSSYNGNKGQRSFDGEHLYICVEDNLWKRVAIDWFVDNGTNGFGSTSGGLNYGVVPIWGTNGGWDFDLVVKDIDAINSTSGNLLVTFTNNTTKILEIGGDRWILPPPMSSVWTGVEGDRSYDNNYFYVCIQDNLWKRVAYDFFVFGGSTSGGGNFFNLPNGYVPIWDSLNNKWDFNLVVSETYIDSSSGLLNVIYSNNFSTSFPINTTIVANLNDLLDVIITNATSGDVLKYNGSNWINELSNGLNWVQPPPSSSYDTGNRGDASYDNDFIYICIQNNVWKRINIDYFLFNNTTSGTSGFSIPFGSVPYWDGNGYSNTFAVVNIQPTIQMGNYGELVTYSNGTSSFISFGSSGNIIGGNFYGSNGITKVGNTFNLGGTLNQNTTITTGSNIFSIAGSNGLRYSTDISSNYTNRSLVDKEYVDDLVNTIITENTTAGNGLNIIGNKVVLGGYLNQNTAIDGTNFDLSLNLNNFEINSNIISLSTNNYDAILDTSLLTQNVNLSFPNSSGTFALVENIHFKINNIYYVSKDGNNITGQKGVITRPYKDIKYVVNLAGVNDYIHVFPGVYDEYDIPTKSNLTIYLEDGVKIEPTTNSGKVAIFTDQVLGQPALNFRILGYGELLSKGESNNDTNCIVASYSNSKYYVEAKYVRSLEAWGQIGAFIHIKNAIIDYEIAAYSGGEVLAENCYFLNLGHSFNSYATTSTSEVKITFNDCYFERNGTNSDYQISYGNDTTSVLFLSVFNPTNSTRYWNIAFNNCSFVQKLNDNNITIKANNFNSDSCIQFNNCKFYNKFNTTKSILYTANAVYSNPSTTTEDNGNLKFILNSNISNVDVDSINTDVNIINEIPVSGMYISQYFRINNKNKL